MRSYFRLGVASTLSMIPVREAIHQHTLTLLSHFALQE
jgi:hypothetical protein